MATLKVRLLGRFAFVHVLREEKSQIQAVMPNMAGNTDLALRRHKPQLAVARCLMADQSMLETSDGSFAVVERTLNSEGAQVERIEEWATWDLTGFEVTVGPLEGTNQGSRLAIVQAPNAENQVELPALGSTKPSVTARTPPSALVASRLHVEAGEIEIGTVEPPGHPQRYVMIEYGQQGRTRPGGEGTHFADLAAWNASFAGDQIEITLRRFSDSLVRKIRVRTNADPQVPLELWITHTCIGGGVDAADFEFAAYYDLMTDTPALEEREIPQAVRIAGDESCYCHFTCQANEG